MPRFEPSHSEAERLDQQWDDLVQGRISAEIDPTLRLLHASLRATPSPLFVGQLRSSLRRETRRLETASALPTWRERSASPVKLDRRQLAPLWMATRQKLGRWASFGLVAIVALMIVAVVGPTYRSGSNDPTSVPAGNVATPSPEWPGLADVSTPDESLGSVWPFGAGGSGDFTIPEGPDPLRIRLARVELPRGASITILPSAVVSFIPTQGTASITNPDLDGTWDAIPPGSHVGLGTTVPTTVANRGEETVMMNALAVCTGEAFVDATGGAEIVMLVDVALDPLRAGPARYTYEGRIITPNMGVIEDASRDGVALLVVDEGAFAVIRDGGKWAFGSVGSPHSSQTILDEGFSTDGQAVLSSSDYAVITGGAAFHGTAANGGEARFFQLTIEVNSAVVQEAESRTVDNTAPPPDGSNGSDGTPSS